MLPEEKVDVLLLSQSKLYWALYVLILLWRVVIFSASVTFYKWFIRLFSKRLLLNHKALSDGKVVLLIEKENGFAVHFQEMFLKSLKSISDKR